MPGGFVYLEADRAFDEAQLEPLGLRIHRHLRAGTVHVNQYDEDDITVPFGGYKQSGNGRDKSLHALEKYTELKTTWLRIDAA